MPDAKNVATPWLAVGIGGVRRVVVVIVLPGVDRGGMDKYTVGIDLAYMTLVVENAMNSK